MENTITSFLVSLISLKRTEHADQINSNDGGKFISNGILSIWQEMFLPMI